MRLQHLDDDQKSALIYAIEQRQVIPVVGEELLVVEWREDSERGRYPVNLYQKLAETLAVELKISTKALPSPPDLRDVIAAHRHFGCDVKYTYQRLAEILESILPTQPPEPLLQLAAIRPLQFYISTTWDSLLAQAIEMRWFGGAGGVASRAYSLLSGGDLELNDLKDPNNPVVFHLFGRAKCDGLAHYAATDADTVDFLCALQHEEAPENLFDALSKRHLLLLGTNYPDWLMRIFLRLLKARGLREDIGKKQYITGPGAGQTGGLVTFLRKFSRETIVLEGVHPLEFVSDLHDLWMEEHPEDRDAPPLRPLGLRVVHPDRAAFVSYASEDRAEAWLIAQQLDAMGWEVWFDRKDLKGGEKWDQAIQQQIEKCALFVPILSATTSGNKPRVFRQEWDLAIKQEPRFRGLDRPYIYPLRISQDVSVPGPLRSFNAQDALNGKLSNTAEKELSELQKLLALLPAAPAPIAA